MQFKDISHCKVGTVLRHIFSKRQAVLVSIFGHPLNSASIQYLDGDTERIGGCSLENFEHGMLKAGILLMESEGIKNAILLEDSSGPLITIRFLKDGEKKKTELCEKKGNWMCARFIIAPAPPGTTAQKKPP